MSAKAIFDGLPGRLPADDIPRGINTAGCASFVENAFEALGHDPALLTEDALWRDWMCFSPRVRTRASAACIASAWSGLTGSTAPTGFRAEAARVTRIPGSSWIDVDFTFSTVHRTGLRAMCSGFASLAPNGETWKIWCLVTILEQFEHHPNPDTPPTSLPYVNSDRPKDHDEKRYAYEVVVVGAGQAGLSVAGRLAAVGIPYLLIEKEATVGSRWTRTYDSVRQHTFREMNNLPFSSQHRTFEDYATDDFLPGWKVAKGYQEWATKYDINVWTSTAIVHCVYMESKPEWELEVFHGSVAKRVVSRHLVLTTGARLNFDRPRRPKIPNEEQFRGRVLHTSDYKNCKGWQGLSAIVIGSATNAHDVAADMVEAGLKNVWMIQRSATAVFPIEASEPGQKALYGTLPLEIADRRGTRPVKVGSDIVHRGMRPIMESKPQAELLDALERKGFRLDRVSTLYGLIASRGGGYYIDVGCSSLIANGDIKIMSGIPIARFTEDGLAFTDGTRIEADIVVFATGYDEDIVPQIADIVGLDVARRCSDYGSLDEEGEQRGVMQECAPGLWCLGGAVPQARFWSRFIVLQIQADWLNRRKKL